MKFPRLAAVLLALLAGSVQADQLDDIQRKGSLVVGVIADAPPFGMFNPDKTVSGYDVDFGAAIAKKLGAKLTVRDLLPAERLPMLKNGQVDLVIGTLTKTHEREREIDFSYGYFVTGQKVLAKRGRFPTVNELRGATVGVARGTTSEAQLRKEFPAANVVSFDDNPQALKFLEEGKLDGISTDEPILAGLLAKMPNRTAYELSSFSVSTEAYGIGVRKGEKRLLKTVNDTLIEMENNGEADRIFKRWFGPQSAVPLVRTFKIRGG
ncbi:transporter substrate-binding domain-containing protein [Chitinimonas lacunae]|uniref:Transporter substrate-binding domain-containing protein n=1 Tax=Chitinimonas lacunae TaxID=1963018 RepID=A0ABV8MW60_9NEIS